MPDESAVRARIATLTPQERVRLSAALRARQRAAPVRPAPRAAGGPQPASAGQRRIWLLYQLGTAATTYHVPVCLRLSGYLDRDALRAALADLVARHEPLRTAYELADGELCCRAVRPEPAALTSLDLSALPATAADRAAQRWLARIAGAPFDLASGENLRAALVRVAERDHLLGLCLHHIAVDAASVTILLDDLGRMYAARAAGHAPDLAPPRLQYLDYAAWQRATRTASRRAVLTDFWWRALADAPPVASPPPAASAEGTGRTAIGRATLVGAALTGRVRQLSRDTRSTVFMTLLTAYLVALARSGAGPDVPVGTPVAGRTHPDSADLVGFLVETLVLRTSIAPDDTGHTLLARVRDTCLGAYEHQDLPFDDVVDAIGAPRLPGVNPVFQTYFALRGRPADTRFGPLEARRVALPHAPDAKFDLSLYAMDAGDDVELWLEFPAERYPAAWAQRFLADLTGTLDAITRDPDRPLHACSASIYAPARIWMQSKDERDLGETTPTSARPALSAADPPRDRWEHYVARAWSEVLNVPAVGRDADFLGLGGHSMAAMLAADRLRRMSGVAVPPAALFTARTVAELASVLRAGEADRSAAAVPTIVELGPDRPGRPLFLLHGAAGELFMYLRLVGELDLDRPCLGVQDPDPGRPPSRMDDRAGEYAERIRERQPDGAYDLCGFSAAGVFALAVAVELVRSGGQVRRLILVDTAPVLYRPEELTEPFVLSWYLHYAPPAAELAALSPARRLAVIREAGIAAGELPADTTAADLRRLTRRLYRNAHALAHFAPDGYPGAVTLLAREGAARDLAREWHGRVARLDVERLPIATHLGMLADEGVVLTAARVRHHLDREGA